MVRAACWCVLLLSALSSLVDGFYPWGDSGRWGYYRDVGTLNCALHSPSSGTNTHIGAYLAVSGHIGGVLSY